MLGALLVAGAAACRQPPPVADTLVILTRSPIRSLDPTGIHDPAARGIAANVFEALVHVDADLRIVPELAVSWSNPRETLWRFELRDGVSFHDGRPMSAADVKASLDSAVRDPQSWLATRLPGIRRVDALDARHVEIETDAPRPLLLRGLADVGIRPADAEKTSLVGTGPYRVEALRRDAEVRLVRASGYWRQAPPWTSATFRYVADAAARRAELAAGRADLVQEPLEGEPAGALPGLHLVSEPGLEVAVLGLRVTPGRDHPFAEPGLRDAIALGLDRARLVDEGFEGRAAPAWQLAPPGVFGHLLDQPEPRSDPAQAAARLRHASVRRAKLHFLARDRLLAQALAAQTAAIGFTLELEEVAWSRFGARLAARQLDAFLYRLSFPNLDSADALDLALHTPTADGRRGQLNFTGYSDAPLDALLERAERELDPAQRYELLQPAMQRALEGHAPIPLAVPARFVALRPGLTCDSGALALPSLDTIRPE